MSILSDFELGMMLRVRMDVDAEPQFYIRRLASGQARSVISEEERPEILRMTQHASRVNVASTLA